MTATAESGARPAHTPSFPEASRALRDAALDRALDPDLDPTLDRPGTDRLAPLLRGRLALRAPTVDLAADCALRDAALVLLTHGWTPSELHTFAAKRLDQAALSYLIDVLAAAAQWNGGPSWRHEVTRIGAKVWWSVGEAHLGQWSRRHGQQRRETVRVAVDVLALLSYLPRTDDPYPGAPQPTDVRPGLVQDARIVGRIDALLARANGTDFPDEAAACAAKAQELMVRYATVPVRAPSAADATAEALKRLCTESPLVVAKTLAAEVAGLVHKAAAALSTQRSVPPRRSVREISGGAQIRRPAPRPVRA